MNQTWENDKKSNFGPFDPNLGSKTFFVNFTSTTSWKLFQAIILYNLKEN